MSSIQVGTYLQSAELASEKYRLDLKPPARATGASAPSLLAIDLEASPLSVFIQFVQHRTRCLRLQLTSHQPCWKSSRGHDEVAVSCRFSYIIAVPCLCLTFPPTVGCTSSPRHFISSCNFHSNREAPLDFLVSSDPWLIAQLPDAHSNCSRQYESLGSEASRHEEPYLDCPRTLGHSSDPLSGRHTEDTHEAHSPP